MSEKKSDGQQLRFLRLIDGQIDSLRRGASAIGKSLGDLHGALDVCSHEIQMQRDKAAVLPQPKADMLKTLSFMRATLEGFGQCLEAKRFDRASAEQIQALRQKIDQANQSYYRLLEIGRNLLGDQVIDEWEQADSQVSDE